MVEVEYCAGVAMGLSPKISVGLRIQRALCGVVALFHFREDVRGIVPTENVGETDSSAINAEMTNAGEIHVDVLSVCRTSAVSGM